MKYVIKFKDGKYNKAQGFAVPLEDATLYASYAEAERVADDLMDVDSIVGHEISLTPSISVAELLNAIEAATIQITVCAPSNDYYRRRDEWEEKTISIIDPAVLLSVLKND